MALEHIRIYRRKNERAPFVVLDARKSKDRWMTTGDDGTVVLAADPPMDIVDRLWPEEDS
jgi:hypothetical protein